MKKIPLEIELYLCKEEDLRTSNKQGYYAFLMDIETDSAFLLEMIGPKDRIKEKNILEEYKEFSERDKRLIINADVFVSKVTQMELTPEYIYLFIPLVSFEKIRRRTENNWGEKLDFSKFKTLKL